ncbi:MAG: SDR family NAD(P)-dependent oxidoreductase [Myxococcota bacterium]|nr:SDR family NAD(P)-dependent oxidoreductase [Myxococcota bacterium]
MLLKGKTAVITGCNRGIGKATLKVFAEHGADVWACVRQVDDEFTTFLEALGQETGACLTPVCFDLADGDAVKEGAKSILAEKKPIDILVNNAGIIHTSLFQMTPVDKMKELFEVNYFSQLLLTQYMVKSMTRKRSGAIVNISSSAAIEGNEGRTAYASSKAAMICSTKVMAKELARANIRVNAIAPGLTMTDMMTGSTPEDALAQTLERICMKRVGEPEEIAKAALFLSSDLSSYMTGQVLRVDGGM